MDKVCGRFVELVEELLANVTPTLHPTPYTLHPTP
jgi:hypothetical protein